MSLPPSARAGLAVVPALAWIPLTFIHGTYAMLHDGHITTWLAVHVGQVVLAPLLALAVWQLIGGLPGAAAMIARFSVFAWVAFFCAFDAIAGISTGLLVEAGSPGAETLWEHPLVGGGFSTLALVAQPLWLVVAIASGVALRENGVRGITQAGVFASFLIAAHAGLPAAIGFAALASALWTGLARQAPEGSSDVALAGA